MGDSDESRGSDNSLDGAKVERMEIDRPAVVPRNAQAVVRRSLSGSSDNQLISMAITSASGGSGSSSISPPATVSSGNVGTERDATGGLLRRSNSAPMFNGPNMSDDTPIFQPIIERQRVRRMSANLTSPGSKTASSSVRTPSRISQIKQEESLDIRSREAVHEREVQSAFQISHSWDGLHLDESIKNLRTESGSRFSDPISIIPPNLPLASSPSPTRVGRQCFSPSMQISVRSNSLTPSPIPSPTRSTFTRRSMSPVLRPSTLKRKYDSDSDVTPPKRQLLSSPTHPSTHSICSLSSDDASPPTHLHSDASSISGLSAASVSTSGSCFSFNAAVNNNNSQV
ncbi:P2R1A-PPP2R2A-interacting phosphatase regulator 1-like [Amphiura filiformis]|uniref:P2R1A-PPP2R2A-interacting phosphatase regulator 1-like n=1 Tax=Amphiura filiformis TaxID=82378 RepID=UPI003B2143AB